MGLLGFNFDLRQQLAFYGAYHRNKGNQIIHFIFVPVIFWSYMVWLEYAPPVSEKLDLPAMLSSFLPDCLARQFPLNWSMVLCLGYSLYYISLEPFAGFTWFLILGIPKIITAHLMVVHVPYAWAIAFGTQALGWIMQINVGHQALEKRKPALLDSLFQALVLAGLFAWMEGLFALGYRKKLQADLAVLLDARVAEMDQQAASRQPLVKPDAQ